MKLFHQPLEVAVIDGFDGGDKLPCGWSRLVRRYIFRFCMNLTTSGTGGISKWEKKVIERTRVGQSLETWG